MITFSIFCFSDMSQRKHILFSQNDIFSWRRVCAFDNVNMYWTAVAKTGKKTDSAHPAFILQLRHNIGYDLFLCRNNKAAQKQWIADENYKVVFHQNRYSALKNSVRFYRRSKVVNEVTNHCTSSLDWPESRFKTIQNTQDAKMLCIHATVQNISWSCR